MQAAGIQHLLVTFMRLGFDLVNLFRSSVFQAGDFGFPATAEDDVSTTTGHVGGDGDSTRATGLGNDLGFFFVVLGVQYLVIDALLRQQLGNHFRGLDRCSTDQNRTTILHAVFDVRCDGGELFAYGQVHQV